MSAGDRFARDGKLVALARVHNGSESYLDNFRVNGMDWVFELPIVLRQGDRIMLEHDRGAMTMYRVRP